MLISGKYLEFNAILIFYDKGVMMPFKQPVVPFEQKPHNSIFGDYHICKSAKRIYGLSLT